ncbi:MAG: hypothetical protein LAO77_12930 [Acidobacteriia bacterium]|nr:hypothetical protein [Terriglobia bacterium]
MSGLFERLDRAFARAAAEKESPDAEARAGAVIGDSRVAQTILWVAEATIVAWRASRARSLAGGVAGRVRALDVARRVHLIGWTLLVATVTRAGLYAAFARPSLVTLGIWGLVVAVGAIMMAAPASIAVAWSHRRL